LRRAWLVLVVAASTFAVSLAAHEDTASASRPPPHGGGAPASYKQAMSGWHAPVGHSAPVDATGRPKLVLHSLNHDEKAELTAATDAGGFSAEDLDRASFVLRSASGDRHPVEPRTLNVVYRIQTHFGAPEIRIVSGYRVPKPSNHSNHGKGRAIDFILPGTPDEEVAKFAREIGFVGVGIYPTSQFVHVDVRPQSYFWIDYSGPGKRNREKGILRDLAIASDKRAIARGERGIAPFEIATDVDRALEARGPVPTAAPQDDDDDGD
jgi:uncharacterized protein YcbK (DUF882 family)